MQLPLQNWINIFYQKRRLTSYKTFQFRQTTQKPEETADQFVVCLHRLAVYCEFMNLHKELRSAVIQHCKPKRLQR